MDTVSTRSSALSSYRSHVAQVDRLAIFKRNAAAAALHCLAATRFEGQKPADPRLARVAAKGIGHLEDVFHEGEWER